MRDLLERENQARLWTQHLEQQNYRLQELLVSAGHAHQHDRIALNVAQTHLGNLHTQYTESQTERERLDHLLVEEREATAKAEAAFEAETDRHLETKQNLHCLQDLGKDLTLLSGSLLRRPVDPEGDGTAGLFLPAPNDEHISKRVGELEEGFGRVEAALTLKLKELVQGSRTGDLRPERAQSNPLDHV